MKKQAHPEVWARLAGQMIAGFEALELARAMAAGGEIVDFKGNLLTSDPFVVDSIEIER